MHPSNSSRPSYASSVPHTTYCFSESFTFNLFLLLTSSPATLSQRPFRVLQSPRVPVMTIWGRPSKVTSCFTAPHYWTLLLWVQHTFFIWKDSAVPHIESPFLKHSRNLRPNVSEKPFSALPRMRCGYVSLWKVREGGSAFTSRNFLPPEERCRWLQQPVVDTSGNVL